jgi:FkbM family methyltransferase
MRDGKVKSLGRRVLSPLLGRPRLQAFFSSVYEISLAAMGYGEGANPAASGEEGALRYVESCLRAEPKVTMFDVGANVGQYAASVLDRWGERVALWCFEPSPSTFRMLGERLREHPQVTLENLGLSDKDGTLTLHTLGEGSKVASLYERRTEQWNLDKTEQIRVRTLDGYCAENRIDSIGYLKLDVEGHELSVLQGARGMLAAGAIRFIQFEFSAACIDARVFFRDYWELLSKDYAIYRVIVHGLAPVVEYDETLEVFKRATNYLAERRPAP